MDKEKIVIPRVTLNSKDSEKLNSLMKTYYLEMSELVKFLIRKEYDYMETKKTEQ